MRNERTSGITAICPKHVCRQVCAQVLLSSQQHERMGAPLQWPVSVFPVAAACIAPWSCWTACVSCAGMPAAIAAPTGANARAAAVRTVRTRRPTVRGHTSQWEGASMAEIAVQSSGNAATAQKA